MTIARYPCLGLTLPDANDGNRYALRDNPTYVTSQIRLLLQVGITQMAQEAEDRKPTAAPDPLSPDNHAPVGRISPTGVIRQEYSSA